MYVWRREEREEDSRREFRYCVGEKEGESRIEAGVDAGGGEGGEEVVVVVIEGTVVRRL